MSGMLVRLGPEAAANGDRRDDGDDAGGARGAAGPVAAGTRASAAVLTLAADLRPHLNGK